MGTTISTVTVSTTMTTTSTSTTIPVITTTPLSTTPLYKVKSKPCQGTDALLARGTSNEKTFRCKGGWCVSTQGRCNGFANCGDKSDEVACSIITPSTTLILTPT